MTIEVNPAIETGARQHRLKNWPEPFQAVLDGRKTAEHRYAGDRDFRLGDELVMQEWDPQTATYTGRSLIAVITDVQRAPAWAIRPQHVVLSIRLKPQKQSGLAGAMIEEREFAGVR